MCGKSWVKAVALHVRAWPNRYGYGGDPSHHGDGSRRFVTVYLCTGCGDALIEILPDRLLTPLNDPGLNSDWRRKKPPLPRALRAYIHN